MLRSYRITCSIYGFPLGVFGHYMSLQSSHQTNNLPKNYTSKANNVSVLIAFVYFLSSKYLIKINSLYSINCCVAQNIFVLIINKWSVERLALSIS